MNKFYITLQRQLGILGFLTGFLSSRIFSANFSNDSLQLKLVFTEVSIYSTPHESANFFADINKSYFSSIF